MVPVKQKTFQFFVVLVVVLGVLSPEVSSASTLHNMSPRVVFTKQGPVQGFLGPADSGIYHTPHYSSGGSGSGRDRGFDMRQYNGKPIIEIFRGIPYASPPIGPLLRYESPSPLPHRSRTEVFNANVSHPSCPRTSEEVLNRTMGGGGGGPMDKFRTLRKTLENSVEDCLYLDIYAPLNSDKSRGNNGLAVLVYMNSHPDDPENPFDGSSVAAIGNIIVISVRYRTGVLGFLQPSYSEDVRANFGLWDQLAALQWIKENIAEFGGDSDNISLMGFDIDATTAGLLSLSPVSQAYNGLFHRLILLNGSPFTPNAINPEPIRTTFQLARALPCPSASSISGSSGDSDLAKCLRGMPVPRLITAAEKNIGAPPLTFPFSPIADGIIVPHEMNQPHPASAPAVEAMLAKYDILCGLKEGPVLPLVGRHTLNNINLDRFITAVIKLTMKMESGSEPTEQVKKVIRSALINDQGYGSSPPMRELISDFLVVQPMIDLLNAHASRADKKTFFYVLKDFDPLNTKAMDEISYIFSSSVYKWKYTGSPSHAYKLHPFVMLINLLANFVRNGDPNISDPTDRFQPPQSWPEYTPEYGRYLEIAEDIRFPSSYRKHSTTFWGKTFHSIMKSFSNKSLTDTSSSSTFPQFPPHFSSPPHYPGHTHANDDYSPNNPDLYYPPPGNNPSTTTTTAGVTLGGQSAIVLIGCLLLLLNFLCFMGLFYQRERLKKAELQLRKRYLDTQQRNKDGGATSGDDIECSSSFVGGEPSKYSAPPPPQPPLQHRRSPHLVSTMMLRNGGGDTMSETETENGFGPDFLTPNYDPKTKVNRWMQMQAQASQQSRDLYSTPSIQQQQNHTHPKLQRLSHVREDDDPPRPPDVPPWMLTPQSSHPPHRHGDDDDDNPQSVTPTPTPSGQIYAPHQHHHHQPQIIPLSHVPPGYLLSSSSTPHPLQFNVNSLPRQNQPHHHHHPPHALPDPPVQFIPQLPYHGSPYKPDPRTMGSDIPYADSRATSPSIISAPAGFANSNGPIIANNISAKNQPKGILVSAPKRSSTLIVRDLDPDEQDGEMGEPKYVPVKQGTLKRSVAVETTDPTAMTTAITPESSFNGGRKSLESEDNISSSAATEATIIPSSTITTINGSNPHPLLHPSSGQQVRVTFKEDL
ncbi:neuroligin-4, X-linked-like isoform X2 [Folsomia candida]|uniref:neuroligin-4, X-linked-like isoform X2 n=1 Tax=Folsomia candida TaxID=158441 RepID=UPI001604AD98|nr:neuroligin-4, X-linked-like isoform X2 [Folsomia candida]